MDPVERRLTRSGISIPLTPKAFDTLYALLQSGGQVITKNALLQQVWPDTFVEEATLAQNIFTLRKALGGADSNLYIETVPRRGYRFVVPVKILAHTEAVPTGVSLPGPMGVAVEPSQTMASVPVHKEVLPRCQIRWWLAILGLNVVLAAVFGVWRFRAVPRGQSPGVGASIRSIVVLPFTNLSGDDSQEYLADGMTDALITDLAKISAFRVISRTSAMHYKGSKKRLPEIAQELGNIDAVVEGSVARSGNRVRLTVQLILANSDQHIWADRYEQDLGEIMALQADLAAAVTRQIAIELTGHQVPKYENLKSMDPQAEEAYLQGRYQLAQYTVEGVQLALQDFQRVIQIEPDNALAYTGIAEAQNQSLHLGGQPTKALPLIMAAAGKALQLDHSIAEAHSLMALAKVYKNRDWQGAEAEFKMALQLSPGSSAVHSQYVQAYLLPLGRKQEVLAESRKALELDPLSPSANCALGWSFLSMREYESAIQQFQKTLELDPDSTIALWGLRETYELLKLYPEAVGAFQQLATSTNENPQFIKSIGIAYSTAGLTGYWRKRVEASLAYQRRGIPSNTELAYVYAQLGQKDRAFQLLWKADSEMDLGLFIFDIDPKFDSLRSDPRFGEMRSRLRLPRTT